jgi:phytoene synthase
MQDNAAHCEALVREADKDRFLATLFAPQSHRAALFALYAFNIEIARIREVVREPMAGEMRLQWWADVLDNREHGAVQAHPVVAALKLAIERYRLPLEPLKAMVEIRFFDLYDDQPTTLEALETYASQTAASLIALAAQILNDGKSHALGEIAEHAGIAYGLAGLLRAFPTHAARGKLYLPTDLMREHHADPADALAERSTPALRAVLMALRARALLHLSALRISIGDVPPALVPALLPLAPVRTLLMRLEREKDAPFEMVDVPQWRRQWLMWRAARNPRRIAS